MEGIDLEGSLGLRREAEDPAGGDLLARAVPAVVRAAISAASSSVPPTSATVSIQGFASRPASQSGMPAVWVAPISLVK